MLKRLARYICAEMEKFSCDPNRDLNKVPEAVDKYEDLKEKLDALKDCVFNNADFLSNSIECLRKRLDSMWPIVDSLHQKKVDETNFMDLVKELTYKINAYEKYKDYQKIPNNQCSLDPLNECNSSGCQTQEQSPSESN